MPLKLDPDAKYPVLAPGRYKAKITHGEEKTSSTGNPMTVLHVEVADGEGGAVEVRKFLVQSSRNAKRLYDECSQIYRACGLPAGTSFDFIKVEGCEVEVTLSVEERVGYGPQNRIEEWFPSSAPKRDPLVSAVNAPAKQAAAAAARKPPVKPASADDIPF